ncbi:sensor histidine kinase [Belliella marina]|uniref:histidine kinase n=1 Tax=Belliella marina TaxID=1644146 RepID=A0ABW4VKN1_9BACT
MLFPKIILSFLLLVLSYICCTPSYGQIQQINQELNKLSSIKDSVSKVNTLNRLGTLYRTRNADSCFYYGMEAKRVATNIKYRQGQTAADHVIAFALFKKGLYAESLELLGKILPYYQKLDDPENIVRVYLDMVEVENKGISDRPKIISLLQKAIQTGKKLEKDSIMAEVYISYLNRGPDLSEDSVRYYLNKSREIARRYNDESLLIFNQLWQASLLISNDRKEEALPLIQQSLAAAKHIGNANLEFNSLVALYNYEDDFQKELEHLYQEYEVVKKSGDKYLEIYILNNALDIAKHLGDKDELIKIYVELEKAMSADWEKSRKFMGDYVKYNDIEDDNRLLAEENKRRTLWVVIISFMALISLMTIYLIMLRRSRKAKEQIGALNETANMQIIAMEEAKHEAVREEQRRLGQDLHDGLSSSIASIKHQLEVLSLDTEDPILKKKLAAMQSQITNAYEIARNKSHEWFNTDGGQQGQTFEQQIRLLIDSALPDSHYQKDIHIDEGALQHIPIDTRIALFRIIQEAITNIIKHAKANRVSILLYEEAGSLMLAINDDGIGLKNKKSDLGSSSMGLKSIKRRVQYLNGKMEINFGSQGTELAISIPISSK